LEFIDFLVYYIAENSSLGQQRIGELEVLLARGGSEYAIEEREGKPGVVRRVPEGVADAVHQIVQLGSSSGCDRREDRGSAPAGTMRSTTTPVSDSQLPGLPDWVSENPAAVVAGPGFIFAG
jgi:hypothetical protein